MTTPAGNKPDWLDVLLELLARREAGQFDQETRARIRAQYELVGGLYYDRMHYAELLRIAKELGVDGSEASEWLGALHGL